MITKSMKISKLLKEYPDSLQVLLRVSPHFSKLQNKILRKALAGRVTVEQAASIAGIDLDYLLSELNNTHPNNGSNDLGSIVSENLQIGMMKERSLSLEDKPEYLKSIASDRILSLDVRPIINSGRDPLKDILSVIKILKKNQIFIITNSFEPIPLYSLLAKQGFSHWTETVDPSNSHGSKYYKVYFYKEKDGIAEETNLYHSSKKISENDFENIIELDVHELQPPEPMMRILENLSSIDEKSVMLVHHHREPVLLYPKLDERGYYAYCEKIGDESFKILIAKKLEK